MGSGYYYFSLLINKGITTISSIFLARTLGPKNFGMISIINYLTLLLLLFTGFGIPTASVKLIVAEWTKERKEASAFITSAFLSNLLIIILITFLFYLFAYDIADRVYRNETLGSLFRISAFALFFFSLTQYGNGVIQALSEFKRLSLLLIFNSSISLCLLIPLTKFFGLRGAVLSQMITSIIVFLLCLRIFLFLCKKYSLTGFWVNFNKIKEQSKKLFSFAFPVFLSGLVMTPALTILTALLSRLRGFQEVGFFNVGYSLTQIILFLPTAVGVPFIPIASRLASEDKERLKDFLLKTIYGVNIIVLLACFIIGFFANEIIYFLFGPKYEPAQKIILLLLASGFLSSFGYIIGYYLLAIGKVWFGTLMNFIWFVIILTPAYHLIKRWGLTGLGLTYLLSYIVLTIVFCFYLKNHLKVKMGQLVTHFLLGVGFLLVLFLFRTFRPEFQRITFRFPAILLEVGIFLCFLAVFILLVPKSFDKRIIKQIFIKRNVEEKI